MLRNGTTLSGEITNAALSLDATSTWTVTGDSALSTLSDAVGISGSAITNIVGNGHTVTYDAGLAGNSALGGKTFSLVNGGTLAPATTNGTTTTTSASGSSGGSEGYTGARTSTVAATTTGDSDGHDDADSNRNAAPGTDDRDGRPGHDRDRNRSGDPHRRDRYPDGRHDCDGHDSGRFRCSSARRRSAGRRFAPCGRPAPITFPLF